MPLNDRQAKDVRENSESMAISLIVRHFSASIYLRRLIAADYIPGSPDTPALFEFARMVSDELPSVDANTLYRAMLRAAGVEL